MHQPRPTPQSCLTPTEKLIALFLDGVVLVAGLSAVAL